MNEFINSGLHIFLRISNKYLTLSVNILSADTWNDKFDFNTDS